MTSKLIGTFPDTENLGRELRVYLNEKGKMTLSLFQDGGRLDLAPRSGMFDTSADISLGEKSQQDLSAKLADLMRRHPL